MSSMYSIDRHIMNDARDLVDSALMDTLHDIHTVTIIMNDGSPEVTIQGYTNDDLEDHLTIITWKGETRVVES